MSREISILTPENVELKFELAGIGSRFLAMLLDSLINLGLLILLGGMFFAVLYFTANYNIQDISPWVIAIFSLLVFILWSAYFLYFEATRNGQTPGKKAIGIRVIRDTGHPIDFRSAFLRNIMRLVDYLPGTYAIGMISIFVSPQYRRLGDIVGGTLVVRTGLQHHVKQTNNQATNIPQPAITYTSSDIPSLLPAEALPHLHNVTREDYRAVRHFFDRKKDLESGLANNLAKKIAEPILAKLQLNPADIIDPIEFLENLRNEWERRMIH
ncbi:MAG: RDD family protein [Armatimonadota bacterium]